MVVVVPQVAVIRVEARKVIELSLDVDGILLLRTRRQKRRCKVNVEKGIPVIHNHMVAARKNALFLDESHEFRGSRLGQHVRVIAEMEIATRGVGKQRIGLDLGEKGIDGLDDAGKCRLVRRQHAAQIDHVGVRRHRRRRLRPGGLPARLELDVVLQNQIGRELLVVRELFPQSQMRQGAAHYRLFPLEIIVPKAVTQGVGEL